MISVLIVDDEYLIRSLIRNSISWEELGLEVIGEAGDGEEALELIEDLRPQIALVDINMPVLNGLELAQRLREGKVPTRVVFLTGYRDFEYAKQAVTYRAFDYLLKPISAEELTATLTRLAREIELERQVSAHVRSIEQASDKGKRLLREQFLHRLAFGRLRLTPAQLTEELGRLEIALEPEGLLALVVEIDLAEGERDDGLYVYAVLNILCELLREEGGFQNIEGISEIDSCAIVLCNAAEHPDLPGGVRRCWNQVVRSVERYFPFGLACGVGGPVTGYDAVPSAIQDAMEALNGKFYAQECGLFFAERRPNAGGPPAMPAVNFEELQMCMDSGEREEGRQLLEETFRRIRKEKMPAGFAKMTALGLVAILYSLSAKYDLSPEIMTVNGRPVLEHIDKSSTCDQVEQRLLDCYDRFMDGLQSARKVSKIVFAAREYIREHYATDLSLKRIASAVFAAPNYVSSLFKKEMGVSVTEYITLCRMKQAAELMATAPELSLLAVSEQVGYTDPYYFSRCFKRYYGVTPSKFLSSHVRWTGEASGGQQ